MTMASNEQQQTTTDDFPDGYYDAQAVGEADPHVLYGTSPNGNDEIAIEMKLLDLNRSVFVILSFSDAAAPFSLERLRALGWKGGSDMAGITANKVQVRAKTESYVDKEGNPKTRQKYEIMTGKGRFAFQKPMDDQQKRGFFARLNQIASQQGAAQKPGGYPANWDASGPTASAPTKPRVDLG